MATTRYSTRRPEIARAITSCWISEVPSKMVWLFGITNTACERLNEHWGYVIHESSSCDDESQELDSAVRHWLIWARPFTRTSK